MENEKSTARDNDLEIVEIAEFKRDNTHKKIAKHEERQRQRRRRFYGILTVFALGFLAAILSCIFVLQMPVVVVCVVLVLEVMIAACLYDAKIWAQAAAILVGIAAGVVVGRLSLMTVGAIVYLAAVLVLYGLRSVLRE